MTFLNTIFLTALVASAIPLLLHIISRRRLPIIDFSTLEFLKRLQKKKAKKIQLRQIILLIIRTLAVAAVVLAFARPALKSGGVQGAAAAVEMVVILDDCLSSSVDTRDGMLLYLMTAKAAQLVEIAGYGDRITFIKTSDPARKQVFNQSQKPLFIKTLEELEPSLIPPDWRDIIQQVDSIFASSSFFNKELFVISPLYNQEISSSFAAISDEKSRIYFLPTGPKRLDNLSIDSVRILTTIIKEGTIVELEASISNNGTKTAEDVLLSVYLNNNRVAQTSVTCLPDEVKTHRFSVTAHDAGEIEGLIKIEDVDALNADNRRYFRLDVPEKISLLAVAGDTLSKFVIDVSIGSDKSEFIDLHWAEPQRWESEVLNDYDVLLLSGIESSSSGAIERVGQFVRGGGGIVIFQNLTTDLTSLSRGMWKNLGFAGAKEMIESGGVNWKNPDLNHPLFSGVFEGTGKPASPVIRKFVDLAVGRGDRVVIALSNGSPLLIERKVGKGRALLYSISLTPESGDILYTGIWAPLLFRSIGYVAAKQESIEQWYTGNRYKPVVKTSAREITEIVNPDGSRVSILPMPVGQGVEYDVGLINQPGFYRLEIKGASDRVFPANIPSGFSRLKRIELAKLSDIDVGEVHIVNNDDNLADAVLSLRFGSELWKPLALAFMLLLISESLISRVWRKEETS